MKKIAIITALLAWGLTASAQQEQMYTQFMFNKLLYNPGYAGNFVSPTLTLNYRNQWMGLDGAPKAMALTYSMPWNNNRAGFGCNIMRQSIGINTNLTLELVLFAYRIQMERGTISMGLQVSMRNIRQDWTDPLNPIDQHDPGIPTEVKSKFVPNFGTGVYYNAYNGSWYAGIALPRILRNSIDFSEYGNPLSREVQHFNAMGGVRLKVSDELTVTPQALLRYAIGAPFDGEVNVSALLVKKYYGGLTYRVGGDGLGESVDASLGIQAIDKLFICFSYDIGLTRLRKAHQGSIEATLRYYFNPPPDDDIRIPSGHPF